MKKLFDPMFIELLPPLHHLATLKSFTLPCMALEPKRFDQSFMPLDLLNQFSFPRRQNQIQIFPRRLFRIPKNRALLILP